MGTHTRKPQANQMTSPSECEQRCATGHIVHTHPRGLDALPTDLPLHNHLSVPQFSLGLWDLRQQQNPSDTGPEYCHSSQVHRVGAGPNWNGVLGETGLNLPQPTSRTGPLKAAKRQLQAWLPLPTRPSASLKDESTWPSCVSPRKELGALLH